MTIRHIDTGEYIQAQQEKIERLQAELQWYRTNQSNGYPALPTNGSTMEIADAIIATLRARIIKLERQNKQQELSIISLCRELREHNGATLLPERLAQAEANYAEIKTHYTDGEI